MYKLSNHVVVSPQIALSVVERIAEAGYKVLVNNRPDGEDPGQPGSEEFASAAAAVGIEYHHMPVTSANFPGSGFEQLADLFDDPERPVFAFCRSGTRCANLWVASRDPGERDAAEAIARGYGLDLGYVYYYLQQA